MIVRTRMIVKCLGCEETKPIQVTIIDDGCIPGLFGTSPFDDEGVPSRRTVVIDRGVLKSYLLNSYTARKLGMRTTGNAARGLTGNAGVGHGNFFLQKVYFSSREFRPSKMRNFGCALSEKMEEIQIFCKAI